jgi:predicted permease
VARLPRSFRFPFRSRSTIVAEVDEELEVHLATVADRLRAQGWAAQDAAREARRRFGDVEYTRDYCRREDMRSEQGRSRMTVVDELLQDLRYALRSLRSAPGFTTIALATLALGVGANTAIFSVVRAVLLEPLPFASADRIVRVYQANTSAAIDQGSFSEPDLIDIRSNVRLAESMGGFFFADGSTGVDLTGDGSPERLSAALVTPGFFETLRPTPLLGRLISADEHDAGRNRVAVLGYELWQRRFAGSPNVVGRTVTINGDPFTVIGVMPQAFTYPATQMLDVWIPLSYFPPDAIGRARPLHFVSAVARLKPGVSLAQFQTEVAGISARLARAYPENRAWDNAAVGSIRESIVGEVRRPLLVVVVAVAMVLLITCVNIASLLLARGSARQRELAVRAALGAGRGRIVRQLVTESIALALAGGVLGALLGYVAVRALAASGAAQLPGAGNIHVDRAVLAFTFVVAVVAGLLFGAVPAIRAASPALEQSLRAGTRGSTGASGQRLRSALVVIEVALAVILAAGASLSGKSFGRLVAVDPGFKSANALVVRLSMARSDNTKQRLYYQDLLQAIRGVPGVTAVATIKDLPTRGVGEARQPEQLGLPATKANAGAPVQLHHVSPGLFSTMGIPLRGGRDFTSNDLPDSPVVFVVNEAAAQRFWPGENVVGKVLHIGKSDVQIVGVVGNVRQRGLSDPVEPAVYISELQNMRSGISIVIRTNGDPLRLANAVREAIWSVDRTQAINEVTTLDNVLGRAVQRPRLLAWLLGGFGVLGLFLGALGIYGLLAFGVAQRTREIGVRTALGAPKHQVLWLVMGHGLVLTVAGVLVGTIAARLLTRQMESVLFGITASDPGTFGQVVVVLLGTALLASWIPARRALAIDPVTALRYD